MTNTSEEGRVPRRSNLRRIRGGHRFSGRGSDNLGTPREFDEVDDAIEPESVHRGVVMRAQPRDIDAGEPDTPAQRRLDVERAAGPAYAKEFRIQLVGRLVMRKIPLDRIAQQLNVSISTVEKDRAAWKKALAEKARTFDVNEYIGGQMEYYDEIGAEAMKIASQATGNNAQPTAMRLAAMRTALASQGDKTRTLQSAGVFEAARFRRGTDGTAMSDIQMLMQQTAGALEELLMMDDAPPRGAPPPSRGSRRSGGMDEMNFENPEDPEVLEL